MSRVYDRVLQGQGWVRPSLKQIEDLFACQRKADPLGLSFHLIAAVMACLVAGFPTVFVTFGALPLACVFVVRMTGHLSVMRPLWFDPIGRWMLLWAGFLVLSLVWSPDRRHGVDEIGQLQFGLAIPLLYPMLDRRRALIAAVGVGVVLGNLSQVVHEIGILTAQPWLCFHRMPGRISGWWDPVVGGSVICAGLGVSLGCLLAAASGRGRLMWGLAAGLNLLGIFWTGTRGAWIGSIVVVSVFVVLALIRLFRSKNKHETRSRLRQICVFICLMIVLVTIGLLADRLTGSHVLRRIDTAQQEIAGALEHADYSTDTGRRILMWRWAVAAWSDHPLVGVGAGGYQHWVQQQTQAESTGVSSMVRQIREDAGEYANQVHAHAHSLYLHLLATTGIVGLVMVMTIFSLAIWSGVRAYWKNSEAGIDIAPALGLIGLLAVGVFDSISVNQQTCNMAMILVSLLVICRPKSVATIPGSVREVEIRGDGE